MHIVNRLGRLYLPSAGTLELVDAFYDLARAWIEGCMNNGWTGMGGPDVGGFGGPRGGPPGGPAGSGGGSMVAA